MSRFFALGGRWYPALAVIVLVGMACGREPNTAVGGDAAGVGRRWVDPPARAGALAPYPAVTGGSVGLSWLEPGEDPGDPGHRLRFARLSRDGWTEPVTVAAGDDFFANWADVPGIVETGDGALLAHWLAKTGDETYAYSIFLARSEDGGETWQVAGKLNGDHTDTEHGFVSWLSESEGARAVWLDGREMAVGDAMTVRSAVVGESVGAEEILDWRSCECCATDAAAAAEGPVVVYRDRDDGEVRDIAVVRRTAEGWSEPQIVHPDGWRIEGCPVNGPAIAASGERVVVGWYTEAEGVPAVKVARSHDGGRTFEEVEVVDLDAPLGRVDVAFDGAGGAWIVWMRRVGEAAELLLRRVDADFDGELVQLGTTATSRSSGFPRMIASSDRLFVVWTQVDDAAPRQLRMVEIVP